MNLTMKKSHFHAAEQDTEAVRCARIDWLAQTSQIDPAQLIFLGESGVTTEVTRRYGRARRGERAGEGVPCGHWRTLTVLGAIVASGWMAAMRVWPIDIVSSYAERNGRRDSQASQVGRALRTDQES